MRINHNIASLNTYRQLNSASNAQSKSMEKLSSGLRINRAGDDAAGLAISEKMRGQIRGLDQGSRNAQDGISLIQTAEGALNETHDILQRMRELANQSANGTATDADRTAMQDELNQLTSEINRIGNTTEFNTQKLLNGGVGSNDGDKITKATSAKVSMGNFVAAGTTNAGALAGSIKVDNVTFDLSAVSVTATEGSASVITKLENITSGGTKLSDLVDIKLNGSAIEITAKSKGATSEITLTTGNAAASNIFGSTAASSTATEKGGPTTVERAGLQANNALGTSDITIHKDDSFKLSVGSDSPIEVKFTSDKTYKLSDSDPNVVKAEMQDMIKDINAALQDAGLSGKVTASLSKDNEVQFISETGQDLKITDGTGTPVVSAMKFAASSDMDAPENVQQVVGPGAQGSGYTTKFQIGANTGQSMTLTINDMRAAALGVTGNAGQAGFTATNDVTNGTNNVGAEAGLNISNKEDASNTIEVIDKAIASVSSERGKLGAVQNRLEHTINNLNTSSENLTAAESRIRDVDMAKEMMSQTKNSILSQAAQAMLAQANQQPQGVLQLLR